MAMKRKHRFQLLFSGCGGEVVHLQPVLHGDPFSASIGSNRFRTPDSKSLAEVLPRITNPIEPFHFMFLQHDLEPPPSDGIHESLGKRPSLLEHLEERQQE